MVKRIIKIQIIGVISFGILTLIITLFLMATPFKEEWSFAALITALCISCIIVGMLQGHSIGKKGLVVGLLASAITMIIVISSINACYNDGLIYKDDDIFFMIPLIFGAVGGVVGANNDK